VATEKSLPTNFDPPVKSFDYLTTLNKRIASKQICIELQMLRDGASELLN
jgi:hypothetical protein